jgi:hypothetical protein
MTEKPAATPEGLVVAVEGKGAGRVRRDLAQIGDVSDLGAAGLFLLRRKSPPARARDSWSDLLGRLPEAAWAAPVLKDADGNELYPTGSVVVRFQKKTTDQALRRFASGHGLAFEGRNEFVAEQATFRPLRPRDVYLPELADRLAALPEVRTAWLGTTARYARA